MNHITLKTLNNRHHAILQACLEGLTNKSICEKFSMKPAQVSVIVNSPNFQHELALRRDKVIEKHTDNVASIQEETASILRQSTKRAAQKLVDLVGSENEATARQSANDLLDRAGFPKVQKQEQKNMSAVVVLDADDLTRLRETLYMDE